MSDDRTVRRVCEPPSACPATIVFGDDCMDDECTFHCGLPKGHRGPHEEAGQEYGGKSFRLIWKRGKL